MTSKPTDKNAQKVVPLKETQMPYVQKTSDIRDAAFLL